MIVLNRDDVVRALPMGKTIEAMKSAYTALSSGRAVVPLRTHLPIKSQDATAIFMPAYVSDDDSDSLAVKIATIFPRNPQNNLPSIHAAVIVMNAKSGEIIAMIEGGTLTAIRTGAGAGAATDLLANRDARIAAIFGSGPQARTQLEAVCTVRPIEEARIFSRNPESITKFITDMATKVNAKLVHAASPTEALQGAQVVCTATNSTTPVFENYDIAPGTHINGVGSYTPQMVEIPPETVARSLVTVDSRSACASEAGEVIQAVKRGLLHEEGIVEIGEIASGNLPGRTSADLITYFKSVGVAVQDAAAATLALQQARRLGLGTEVNW